MSQRHKTNRACNYRRARKPNRRWDQPKPQKNHRNRRRKLYITHAQRYRPSSNRKYARSKNTDADRHKRST